jgi:hypothetical protein
MERILRHHFPDLSLDIDALRHTCESLSLRIDVDQDQSDLELAENISSVPASDSPGIEDENCTLDYVDDTTVRTCSFELEISVLRADTMILTRRRLLR